MIRSTNLESIAGKLPPWLWFWLCDFLVLIAPTTFLVEYDLISHQIEILYDPKFAIVTSELDRITAKIMVGLGLIVELAATVALIAGTILVFLPKLRARYVKYKYELLEPTGDCSVHEDVADFVRRYATALDVQIYPTLFKEIAFVYPLGYRKTALALGAPFLKLWRGDRQLAEAILLHEIAHHRHGDALIVGAGSLVEYIVKYWFWLLLLFFVLPFAVTQIVSNVESAQEIAQIENVFTAEEVDLLKDLERAPEFRNAPLPNLQPENPSGWSDRILRQLYAITPLLGALILSVFGIIAGFVMEFFFTASILVLPLVAIWSAELNADRYVLDVQGSSAHLLKALQKLREKESWWQRLLFRISHPPIVLRMWLASQPTSAWWMFGLLLLFPMAYFVNLMMLVGWSTSLRIGSHFPIHDIVSSLPEDITNFLNSRSIHFLIMGIVLLFWPLLSGWWEVIASGDKGRFLYNNVLPYIVSASVLIAISIFGYLL